MPSPIGSSSIQESPQGDFIWCFKHLTTNVRSFIHPAFSAQAGNATVRLDLDNEPKPPIGLMIREPGSRPVSDDFGPGGWLHRGGSRERCEILGPVPQLRHGHQAFASIRRNRVPVVQYVLAPSKKRRPVGLVLSLPGKGNL